MLPSDQDPSFSEYQNTAQQDVATRQLAIIKACHFTSMLWKVSKWPIILNFWFNKSDHLIEKMKSILNIKMLSLTFRLLGLFGIFSLKLKKWKQVMLLITPLHAHLHQSSTKMSTETQIDPNNSQWAV